MLPSSRVIGHKEYAAGRKVDPIYPMDWRRRRVDAFTPTTVQEDDMFEAPDRAKLANVELILAGIQNQMMDPAIGVLPQLARVAAQLAIQSPDVDENQVARQVIAGLAPQVAAAVGQAGGLTEERIRAITTEVVRGAFADLNGN